VGQIMVSGALVNSVWFDYRHPRVELPEQPEGVDLTESRGPLGLHKSGYRPTG